MDAIDNHVTSKPLDGETVLDGLLIIVDSKEAVERSKVHNYWQFSYKAFWYCQANLYHDTWRR